jgi:hypothetical protein
MGAFPGWRLVVPFSEVSEILTVIPVFNGTR